MASSLSLWISIQSSPRSSWRSIRCNILLRCVWRDPMNRGFMIKIIYEYNLVLLWILICMIWYLCKSLRIISLVRPTRLIFLTTGEVLSFGFNLAVLDPSDRKGTDTYCIVAIEDKKMGFISYCLSLSLYIMSSCLMRYSVLMNLIL